MHVKLDWFYIYINLELIFEIFNCKILIIIDCFFCCLFLNEIISTQVIHCWSTDSIVYSCKLVIDIQCFCFPLQDILQVQPYHVDAIIQLSEVFRMSEDMNMAAELIGLFKIYDVRFKILTFRSSFVNSR